MDLVGTHGVDADKLSKAQQDLASRFGQSAAEEFQAMDLVQFRLYPQIIADQGELTGDGKKDFDNRKDDFAKRVRDAYTGVRHEVAVSIEDSTYAVDEFEARYYKVYPDGTVEHFDWDPVTGTGAKAEDTDGDGFYDLFSLYIREGGRGDVDGVADGVVLDPGFGVFFKASSAAPAPLPEQDDASSQMYASDRERRVELPAQSSAAAPDKSDALAASSAADALSGVQSLRSGLQQAFGEAGPLHSMADRSHRMAGLIRAISEPYEVDRSSSWMRAESTFEMTQSTGFRTLVMPLDQSGLAVLRGHPDLYLEAGERYVDVINPDAFVHSNPAAQILLKMDLAGGEALPEWVQFNGRTGELVIEPPADAPRKLILRVTAVDDQGNEQSFVIRLDLTGQGIGLEQAFSLVERLRGAS